MSFPTHYKHGLKANKIFQGCVKVGPNLLQSEIPYSSQNCTDAVNDHFLDSWNALLPSAERSGGVEPCNIWQLISAYVSIHVFAHFKDNMHLHAPKIIAQKDVLRHICLPLLSSLFRMKKISSPPLAWRWYSGTQEAAPTQTKSSPHSATITNASSCPQRELHTLLFALGLTTSCPSLGVLWDTCTARAPCRGWPGQQQRSSLRVLRVSQYCVSQAGQTRICWGPAEIQKILEGSKGSSVPRWENATRKERGFQFSLSYSGAWLMPWDTIKSVNIWKLNNNLLIINFNWEPLQNEIAVWQSTNFQHHSQQHGWQNTITDLNFLHRSGEASDARRRWD